MEESASVPKLYFVLEVISFLIVSILLIKKSLESWTRSADILPIGRTTSFEPSNKCFATLNIFLDQAHTMLFSLSSTCIGSV